MKPYFPNHAAAQEQSDRVFTRRREILLLILLVIIVFSVFSNTLRSPFILDDADNILNNRHIRLNTLSVSNLVDAGTKSLLPRRPVANISFALNYFFSGYDVFAYHLVNIFIHIAAALLLYLFFKTTLFLAGKGERAAPEGPGTSFMAAIPFFAALIWAVHPVQTQSVTYIIQRMNSMAAMFYILSMLFYIKGRMIRIRNSDNSQTAAYTRMRNFTSIILFAASFVSGLLALGSKEIAITLPFFILLYDWYFFQDLSMKWLKRKAPVFGLVFLLLLGVIVLYLGENPVSKILSRYDVRDFTPSQRMLTELRVVVFYITLLIFPHPSRLNLEHDFGLSNSLTDPMITLFCLAGIAALFLTAIYSSKKKRILSFAILWFLGNLVVESTFIGLELVFEHRLYLPSMMACLALPLLFGRHIKKPVLVGGLLLICVAVLAIWTYDRNRVWKNEVTLLRDCIQKSPNKERPHTSLGSTLFTMGKKEESLQHLAKALALNPNYHVAHNNMGVVLISGGSTDAAIRHFETALSLKPRYADAQRNLTNALHEKKLKGDIRMQTNADRHR